MNKAVFIPSAKANGFSTDYSSYNINTPLIFRKKGCFHNDIQSLCTAMIPFRVINLIHTFPGRPDKIIVSQKPISQGMDPGALTN